MLYVKETNVYFEFKKRLVNTSAVVKSNYKSLILFVDQAKEKSR